MLLPVLREQLPAHAGIALAVNEKCACPALKCDALKCAAPPQP
jgi:hypothetical protein